MSFKARVTVNWRNGLGIQFFEFSRIRMVQIGDMTGNLVWKESCFERKEGEDG